MNGPTTVYRKPIDMVVVGGYLGAGKTTLLNHLLANARGCRITVLVNDFGDINIDAALIRARTDDVINLENGCICCSIGGRLIDALIAISSREERPDLLLIEASGVSDPARIAQVGMLDRAFRLCGIVVVVDTERVCSTLLDPYVGDIVRSQIASATALVLGKVDLVSEARKAIVRRDVTALARTTVVIESVRGKVPLELFLDTHVVSANATGLSRRPRRDTHAGIRSFAFHSDSCLDRERLKAVLRSLPAGMLRAKGIVRLAEEASWLEVHVVGGRILMKPFAGPAAASSAIVFIGYFDAAEEAGIAHGLEDAKTQHLATH